MKRASRFAVRAKMLPQGISPGRAPGPRRSAPALPATEALGFDPLKDLLQSLRGQEVVLQVGDLCRKGKVTSVDPVVLVDPAGKATMIRFEAIRAVEF